MTPESRRFVIALAAVLTGLAFFRRRPVRLPDVEGDWHPADR